MKVQLMDKYRLFNKWYTHDKLIARYRGLDISAVALDVLYNNPAQWCIWCNGVGSTVGWFNKFTKVFIPDTIWLMDVKKASDIHDVEYSIPETFASPQESDRLFGECNLRLKNNIDVLATRSKHWVLPKFLRARFYQFVCDHMGRSSWDVAKKVSCL